MVFYKSNALLGFVGNITKKTAKPHEKFVRKH